MPAGAVKGRRALRDSRQICSGFVDEILQNWIVPALFAAAGTVEIKRRTKHVEAAMAGFSDVGSTPTVSTN